MKTQREVRAFISTGQFVNTKRRARKQLLKKLGISNKKFKRMNKKAKLTGEGYHFAYNSEQKQYTGTKSE